MYETKMFRTPRHYQIEGKRFTVVERRNEAEMDTIGDILKITYQYGMRKDGREGIEVNARGREGMQLKTRRLIISRG